MSKRSRAARRGEVDLEGEAKSLASVPKAENSDVRKSIIRTTIKNENLLAKKMEKDAIRKKSNKKKTSALKHKLGRGLKLDGVLASKIQQSIDRAKYVQTARKLGWDQINKGLNVKTVEELRKQDKLEKPRTEEEMEMDEEDAYVEEFFKDTKSTPEEAKTERKPDQNAFALLEETEA